MNSETKHQLFEKVEPDRSVLVQIENLSRGIDNYHIDIKLSKKFTSDVKKLVPMLVSQIAVPKPKHWDNSALFDKLRSSYLDVMTVLIHRSKTDLTTDTITVFQFSLIKYILTAVRSQLDKDISNVSSKLAEFRNKGSSDALAADQRLFWLKKNYDQILYAVNKQIFGQLQRTEERQLDAVRNQFLGEQYSFAVEALLNPLLFTAELSALPLLLTEFSMWSWNAQDSGFIDLNKQVEALLNKHLKSHPVTLLKSNVEPEDRATEIHDELGGLFKTQNFLGLAYDSKTRLG